MEGQGAKQKGSGQDSSVVPIPFPSHGACEHGSTLTVPGTEKKITLGCPDVSVFGMVGLIPFPCCMRPGN